MLPETTRPAPVSPPISSETLETLTRRGGRLTLGRQSNSAANRALIQGRISARRGRALSGPSLCLFPSQG